MKIKEFIISIKAGTSPLWYNYSIYAYSEFLALKEFIDSDLCPYNLKEIKIKEA